MRIREDCTGIQHLTGLKTCQVCLPVKKTFLVISHPFWIETGIVRPFPGERRLSWFGPARGGGASAFRFLFLETGWDSGSE
jgi:hypothetical protein